MRDINGQGNTFGEVFKAVFQTIAVIGANVAFVFENIAREIGHTIDNAKLLAKFDFAKARSENEKYWAESDARAEKLAAFERRIMGDAGGGRGFMRGDEGTAAPAAIGVRRTIKPGVDVEAEKERKRMLDLYLKGLAEENKQREETNKLQAEQETFYQKGNAAQAMQQELAGQTLDREKERMILADKGRTMRSEDLHYAQAALEIEYHRKDVVQAITDNQALDQDARKVAYERNNALAEQALELEKQRLELARQSREGGIGQGFLYAADATFRNAKTEFERGGQMFDSVMGNMQASLDNFVRTGKLSFKDLTRSIIQGLISIQLQAQMLSMFKGLGGLFKGGGGGAAIGELGSSDLMGSLAFMAADGGDVPQGRMGLVGERGPELFVPKTAGTIIPNNALGALGGGGQTVNYNGPYIASMSAIDTQSGLQFLAKNKASVWSAYQSANRSIPMSR